MTTSVTQLTVTTMVMKSQQWNVSIARVKVICQETAQSQRKKELQWNVSIVVAKAIDLQIVRNLKNQRNASTVVVKATCLLIVKHLQESKNASIADKKVIHQETALNHQSHAQTANKMVTGTETALNPKLQWCATIVEKKVMANGTVQHLKNQSLASIVNKKAIWQVLAPMKRLRRKESHVWWHAVLAMLRVTRPKTVQTSQYKPASTVKAKVICPETVLNQKQ